MALLSTIAALENQERGACILNWFFNEEPDQKMDLVFRAMERYADSSPPRLFVAVVEASSGCGKFPRSPEGQE